MQQLSDALLHSHLSASLEAAAILWRQGDLNQMGTALLHVYCDVVHTSDLDFPRDLYSWWQRAQEQKQLHQKAQGSESQAQFCNLIFRLVDAPKRPLSDVLHEWAVDLRPAAIVSPPPLRSEQDALFWSLLSARQDADETLSMLKTTWQNFQANPAPLGHVVGRVYALCRGVLSSTPWQDVEPQWRPRLVQLWACWERLPQMPGTLALKHMAAWLEAQDANRHILLFYVFLSLNVTVILRQSAREPPTPPAPIPRSHLAKIVKAVLRRKVKKRAL